jgi:ribonucleotide monophosphatase NagD (HAD superfamily)
VLEDVQALLVDLDGVLYVEEQPITGAVEAVERLRRGGLALRFVTNTTAHSRARTLQKLSGLDLPVAEYELVTPAALAVAHCRERGHDRVALIMNDEVKQDFAELRETADDAEAVIIGDLGEAFGYDVLNHAFRQVMDGAELIALQKNRYWLRADGL